MRILLFDTDAASRERTEALLADLGHEVTVCSSLKAARGHLLEVRPALFMAGLRDDGTALLEFLRERRVEPVLGYPPAVVLLPEWNPETWEHARQAGAQDALIEPLDARSLDLRLRVMAAIAEHPRGVKPSEQLVQMAEHIQDVLYLFDPVTVRTLYINPAFESIWGRPVQTVYDEPLSWMQYIHEDDRDHIRNGYMKYAKQFKPAPTGMHFRIVRPDGAIRWVHHRAFPVYNAQGEFDCFAGIICDETDRQKVEDALRQSEARFRLFVEQTPAAVAMFDSEMRYVAYSRRWREDLRVRSDDPIGKPCAEVTPLMPERWQRAHQRGMKGAVETCDEDVLLLDPHEKEFLRWQVYPWHNDRGDIGGTLIYAECITRRRRMEMDLRQSQTNLAEAQQLAQLGSWEGDLIRREMTWSEEMYRIYGLDPRTNSPTMDDFWSFIHPDDYEKLRRVVDRALNDRLPYDAEFRIIRRDGQERFIHTRAHVYFDNEGQPERMVGSALDVSELKRAERMFRDLVESAPDAMVIVDPDGVIEEVNARTVSVFGYAREELLGHRVEILMPERFRRDHVSLRQGFFAQNISRRMGPDMHLVGRHKNGREFPIEINLSVLTTKEGLLAAATVRDITERVETEKSLRSERDLLDNIMKTSVAAILMMDTKGDVIFANGLAEQIYELNTKEADPNLYRRPACRVASLDGMPMPEEKQPFFLVMATGEPVYGIEHALEWADGRRKLLSVNAAPLRDVKGRIESVVLSIDDITARKEAEESLAQSEARWRLMWENAPDVMLEADLEGRILSVNKVLNGYSREDVIGSLLHDFVGDSQKHLVTDAMRNTLATGQTSPYEVSVEAPSGQTWWAARLAPHHVGDKIRGFLVISTDVTESRKQEAERRKLEDQLQYTKRMEAVGELAGGIAHDFNNILSVINGYVDLAMSDLGDRKQVLESLNRVLESADRAADLTRQLLAFGRRQVLQPVALNLNPLIEKLLVIVQRLVDSETEVRFTPQRTLPNTHADRMQIEQVLLNLILNAQDAMPDGGRLTISTDVVQRMLDPESPTATQDSVPFVRVTISDTGRGMTQEQVDHMFEPFYTTKEKGRGTGLGLATAYGVVQQHHGTIEVATELGSGTTMHVFLPVAEVPEPESAPVPVETAPPGGTETILVADDEDNHRQALVMNLRQAGYTVLEASDGDRALELFQQHTGRINLLLLDVVMPGANGVKVQQKIHEKEPGVPCLFMSGYSASDVHEGFVLRQGLELLQKPFRMRELLKKIREVLATQGATRKA